MHDAAKQAPNERLAAVIGHLPMCDVSPERLSKYIHKPKVSIVTTAECSILLLHPWLFAGPPVSCDYDPKGTISKIGDVGTYFVGQCFRLSLLWSGCA